MREDCTGSAAVRGPGYRLPAVLCPGGLNSPAVGRRLRSSSSGDLIELPWKPRKPRTGCAPHGLPVVRLIVVGVDLAVYFSVLALV